MNDQLLEMPASFNEQIKALLLGEDPTKALELITDEAYLEEIKNFSWNIVEIISPHLTIENAKENIPLFKTCETLLYIMAEKCKASETVLQLLEQMEAEENDVKFCALLKPLQQSFKKLSDKSKAFDWCINTFKSYLESLPLPDEIAVKKIDYGTNECRIIDLYREILCFLEPFIEEATSSDEGGNNFRIFLLSLLLSMLGKPFCYIQPNFETLEDISKTIVNNICKLTGDCLQYLTIVVDRNKQNHDLIDKSPNTMPYILFVCQVSDLAYANFYYLLMTRETLQENIPQIYDSVYILHNCFYLAHIFLQNMERVLISKGLSFIESVMFWTEKFSLGQQALESPVHSKLFPCLNQIMIYCESEKDRKRAVDIYRSYVDLFTLQARYQVVLHLYKITNHSGILGLLISIVKDSVIKCLAENPPCPYFLGRKLQILLSLLCKLPHGSSTDLIEIADEIIAALNLLRFLAIRDKENITGFWDYIEKIEKTYLQDLRTGIDLTRAHWKVKVKDLDIEKSSSKTEREKHNNVTVTVGGENLSMLPASEKIKVCYQALNALDMMENILTRLNECLEDYCPKL